MYNMTGKVKISIKLVDHKSKMIQNKHNTSYFATFLQLVKQSQGGIYYEPKSLLTIVQGGINNVAS